MAKKKIQDKRLAEAKDSSSRLAVQGDLCKVLEEDAADIDWKTIIYKVPKGVMAFACRAFFGFCFFLLVFLSSCFFCRFVFLSFCLCLSHCLFPCLEQLKTVCLRLAPNRTV